MTQHVGLTAWQVLFGHANLKAGRPILVNGASGAVGGYAVQLAKAVGAHAIATATPRTCDQVTAHAADEIVDHYRPTPDSTPFVVQELGRWWNTRGDEARDGWPGTSGVTPGARAVG